MAVITAAFGVMKTGLIAFGGYVAMNGIVSWGQAHREHNGAEKSKATDSIVGGAVIIIAALKLIPVVQELFS